MESFPNPPDPGGLDTETIATVDIPLGQWPRHSLLSRAQLNHIGDSLEWPKATIEQLPFLREIVLVMEGSERAARIATQFNFDYFVDSATDETGPAQPDGHVPDRQRFYTRVTANGFHVVGVFSAATLADRRRYFQWLTGAWVEIGLHGFLYVRDDFDTHFSEVSGAQLDETQPGATAIPLTPDEEWTVETVHNKFVGEAMVDPVKGSVELAAESMFEPVIEPLTAANFPPIVPPDPDQIVAISSSPAATAHRETAEDDIADTAAVQRGIAMAIATIVHSRDIDLVGASTIDHVARVAEGFDPTTDHLRHCAAWLHDVLDSSELSERDLLDAGVRPEIVDIVSLLAFHEGIDRNSWLARIIENPNSHAIKLRSVADNAAPWRLRRLEPGNRAVFEKELAADLAVLKGD